MIRTLQKKFVRVSMTVVTCLLVLLLGGINLINAQTTIRQSEGLLTMLATGDPGKHFLQIPLQDPGRPGFLTPPWNEDTRRSAVFFTAWFGSDGQLSAIDVSHITSITEDEAVALAETVYSTQKTSGKRGIFRYRLLSSPDGKETICIFLDTTLQTHAVLQVLILSGLAGILCWGAMFLLCFLLAKRAIAPIAANLEKQKHFVTDAGHEIKTPLAIILANTEAMELCTGENKWSRNIREQTHRLNGLMQNLLTLARIDETASVLHPESLPLSELITDLLRMFREPLELKHVPLEADLAPGINFSGNREQINRLFSILIENAVKYVSPEGSITVSLFQQEKFASFTIENTCFPLPDCPPEKLFDRFYRADSARTQKSGGYGIGLSAAQAIIELHKGSIVAEYPAEDRIRFSVKFPL